MNIDDQPADQDPTNLDAQPLEAELVTEAVTTDPIKTEPPKAWPPFVALVVAFIAATALQVVVAVVYVSWILSSGVEIEQLESTLYEMMTDPPTFMVFAMTSQIGFASVALGAARLGNEPFNRRLGLVRPKFPRSLYPFVLLSCIPPTIIGLLLASLVSLVIPPDESVANLYKKMTIGWALPFILFIAFAPGFAEELLFRGYCQRRWLQCWSPRKAILVTSLIFAVFHIMPQTVVFAFPIGCWLGYIAWKSDSTWPSIWCHAFVNGFWNILQISFMMSDASTGLQLAIGSVLLVVGAIAFVITMRGLSPTDSGVADF